MCRWRLSTIGLPLTGGWDDVALWRWHVYRAVLFDLVIGRPVDVLTDGAADTLAGWLKNWSAPGWWRPLIPGRARGYGIPEEIPR